MLYEVVNEKILLYPLEYLDKLCAYNVNPLCCDIKSHESLKKFIFALTEGPTRALLDEKELA